MKCTLAISMKRKLIIETDRYLGYLYKIFLRIQIQTVYCIISLQHNFQFTTKI